MMITDLEVMSVGEGDVEVEQTFVSDEKDTRNSDELGEEETAENENKKVDQQVILPMEMMLKLFCYVDRSSIFQCRRVNMLWKDAAEEALAKLTIYQSVQLYLIERFMNHAECAKWVAENIKGNWFTSNDEMANFLENYEESRWENPFPTRTIIIYFPSLGKSELPEPVRTSSYKRMKVRLEYLLNRFVNKFKNEIRNCYLILTAESELESLLFRSVFGLANLKSLTLYRYNWQAVPFIGDRALLERLPRLEELNSLQIFGANGIHVYREVFFVGGYQNQIKNFRVGPDIYQPITDENGTAIPCQPVPSVVFVYEPSRPFLELVPKVKKLVLHNPCANEIQLLGSTSATGSNSELEEFSIAITKRHICSNSSLVGDVLKALDSCHSTSLKKLYFYITPCHFRRVTKLQFLSNLAETITYPNVKILTISHAIVRHWPVILEVLGKKCPNLEQIVFHGQLGRFKKFEHLGKETIKSGFLKYCKKNLFNILPTCVQIISVPNLGLTVYKPKA